MHSPVAVPAVPPLSPPGVAPVNQLADRAYQGVTIIAMILLLASLCLFW